MASILPQGKTQFFNALGAPVSGGSVYTYVPGTTKPATTWQDQAQTIANPNPITLDSSGSCLLLGVGTYRVQVFDASGALVSDTVTGLPSISDLGLANAVPILFGASQGATTSISATSPSFTAPANGALVCPIQGVCSVDANPITATASLGGGTLTTAGGYRGPAGLFTLGMLKGQSTTLTIGVTAPASGNLSLTGVISFAPGAPY